MTLQQYTRKPLPVDAIQYTGDNADAITAVAPHAWAYSDAFTNEPRIVLEGTPVGDSSSAGVNDYIIIPANGPAYAVRQSEFNKLYDKVTDQ